MLKEKEQGDLTMNFSMIDNEKDRAGFLDGVRIPWLFGVDVTEIRPTGRIKVRISCRLPVGDEVQQEK